MRNLVLLCLDTVREDYFRKHAPRLRERADLTFTQCRAASSWSVPSHASMFTGDLPHEHGVHTHNRDFSKLSRSDTFLGELPGHRALGASANVWASSSFGFDGLFDEFSDVSPDRRFPEGIDVADFGQRCDKDGIKRQIAFLRAVLAHDQRAKSLANGILVQIDDWFSRLPIANPFDDGASVIAREIRSQIEGTSEPFVLFGNFMDAHGPLSHIRGYDRSLHTAPLNWTSEDVDWGAEVRQNNVEQIKRYTGLYGASIDYLDKHICDLVDWIHTHTTRDTTVIVTSDHGDEMGTEADGNRWGHTASSLSEGLLHVPLLVLNAPKTDTMDIETSQYVTHLALSELIVDFANDRVANIGRNMIPAERIGHSGSLATVEKKRGTKEDRLVRAVYRGDKKYEWDSQGNHTVYQLDSDRPNWQTAVDESFDPSEFDEFFPIDCTEYKQQAVSDTYRPDVSENIRSRLDDLGYV